MKELDEIEKAEQYNFGDIECIRAIESALTPEEFRGFCKGNVMKYLWRERYKGGEKSWKKAKYYIKKGVESINKEKKNGAVDNDNK